MDNLSPLGQLRPMSWFLSNKKGEIIFDSAQADPEPEPVDPAPVDPATSIASPFSWKSKLGSDLQGSPLLQKFDDSPEGLGKAFESHANLEKLLGHEKAPIPKGPDDTEGWNAYSKAMGIPDRAEQYGLETYELPEALKDSSMTKQEFSEIAHSLKLTPAQAEAGWKVMNDRSVNSYTKAMENMKAKVDEGINRLRGEWGDAYETNVELGQMVINKFTEGNDEANEYITAALVQNPEGIKFLKKIGEHFAENKIGEFQIKRFSLAPEEAQNEIDKIVRDPDHPYSNQNATDREHKEAVDYVNSLYASINRAKG